MIAISPFITPGTVSTVSYNHYSYVRTIEDMFHLTPGQHQERGVPQRHRRGPTARGHIGFAGSQRDLTLPAALHERQRASQSMGQDVFDNPSGSRRPRRRCPIRAPCRAPADRRSAARRRSAHPPHAPRCPFGDGMNGPGRPQSGPLPSLLSVGLGERWLCSIRPAPYAPPALGPRVRCFALPPRASEPAAASLRTTSSPP